MVKVFLNLKNSVVKDEFARSLFACGVSVVDVENVADYVIDDAMDNGVRLCNKDETIVDVFNKPVDFRDIVHVLERLDEEKTLWEGCPVVVNFATGVAKCVKGKNAGAVVTLTDLQQKLLKAVMTDVENGVCVDDVCVAVYGKVDVWAKSNLDVAIYNLNKRLLGFTDKPKIIVKTLEASGRIGFAK